MEPHRSHCGWFWAWTTAGFGLVLGFLAIFSLGPFLLVGLLGIAAAISASRTTPTECVFVRPMQVVRSPASRIHSRPVSSPLPFRR